MRLGDPQSFNRYAYVSGGPVNFIDPSGLYERPPCDGGRPVFNSNGIGIGWICPVTRTYGPGGGGGGGRPPIVDSGGGRGGTPGTSEGLAPPLNSPRESVNDCRKRERLKCEQIGRDYFNANAPTDVVKAILGVPALLTAAGGTVAAGRQLTFREFVKIIRPLLGKAGPYGAVFAGVWALYDITQHAVALENECKRHIEEKCRR